MSELEDRLGTVLGRAAGTVSPRPLEPDRPFAIVRRRRRSRLVTRAAAVLVALAGIGAVMEQTRGGQVEATGVTGDSDGLPVSTGPPLEWERVEDLPGAASQVVWTGQRFVAVIGDQEFGDQEFGDQEFGGQEQVLYASDDGQNWEPLANQPPGPLTWVNLAAQGDSLMVWGPSTEVDLADVDMLAPPSETIYRSVDHGETWELVGVIDNTKVEDPTVYVQVFRSVIDVVAAGDTVMALTLDIVEPDLERILQDEGLIEAGTSVQSYGFDFTGDETATLFYCEVERGVENDVPPDVDDVPFGFADDCEDVHEVEVEGDWVSDLWQDEATLLVSEFGGPLEGASVIDGLAYDLDFVDGRFLTLVAPGLDPGEPFVDQSQLMVSDDGRVWTQTDLPGSAASIHGLDSDGSLVVASGTTNDGEPVILISTDGGRTWDESPTDVHGEVSVGPGGMLATGSPAGSVVSEIIDMVLSSGGNPGAGSDLVGWSSDGEAWNWQSTADAFEESGFPVMAVGQDHAVALVFGLQDTGVFVAELD